MTLILNILPQAVLHVVSLSVVPVTVTGGEPSTGDVSQRSGYYWQRHPVFSSSGSPMQVNIEPQVPTNVLVHPALRPLFNRHNREEAPSFSEKTKPIDQTVNPLQAQPIIDAMASVQ